MTTPAAPDPHEFGPSQPIGRRRSRLATVPARYAGRLRSSEAARLRAEQMASGATAELARLSRLTSVGQFAFFMAHEVNQPIAAIVTSGEAALRWLAKDDIQEVQAAIGCIIRDANRAHAVISGTRAMLARDKPEFFEVDLNQVVRDVVLLTLGERRRSRISLRISLDHRLPPVKGDRILLQQVVLNLVLNGMEAMRDVLDGARSMRIRSRVTGSGEALVVVEDCGVGIDPADAERIFDHFVTTKPDGMGLGLPISRSIVIAHGGRLWAEPASPAGAAFQFTIPASMGP